MSSARTMQANTPEEIRQVARQIIHDAGLSVDEVVQGLMCRIAQEHGVPPDLLQMAGTDGMTRANALDAIKSLRKNRITPAASIEDIIAWRDEGRR